mmetsp:Transcript_73/g.80  ORF Transcript_73/g.80 Transcript_73/m.80 type:complete len:216 (+) Transcript_73:125-772(+)
MTSKADIQYWKDTIISEIDAIHNLIKSAENATEDDLAKFHALDTADEKLRSTQSITRSLKKEIRLIFDHEERSLYNKDLKRYEQSISNILTKLITLRSAGDRKRLFLGAKNNNNPNLVGHDDDFRNEEDAVAAGDAILKDAEHLQNETGQSLKRTKQMIEDAKMVAASTVEGMKRQREKIQNIDTHVSKVNDGLNRSDMLIKTFRKRIKGWRRIN